MNEHTRVREMIQQEARGPGVIQMDMREKHVPQIRGTYPTDRQLVNEPMKCSRGARVDNRGFGPVNEVARDGPIELEVFEIDALVVVHDGAAW